MGGKTIKSVENYQVQKEQNYREEVIKLQDLWGCAHEWTKQNKLLSYLKLTN